IKGIRSAHTLFANLDISNMRSFNATKSTIDENFTEEMLINGVKLTIKTTNSAIGFVIVHNNSVYVYSTEKATIKINESISPFVNLGHFDENHNFVVESKVYPSGENLAIEPNNLNQFTLRK